MSIDPQGLDVAAAQTAFSNCNKAHNVRECNVQTTCEPPKMPLLPCP